MKFRYSLENLRGLSILFVVLSHLGSVQAPGTFGKYAYFILSEATSWFIFLAGYLFYHIEGKRFKYSDYLVKKLKFTILPYFILSIPAIAAGLYTRQSALMGLSTDAYVGWSLLVGGSVVAPMWFIPMIAIFYLLSPLFNRLASSRLMYPLAALSIALTLFSFRPVTNMNPFLSVFHFLGFYLMGIVAAANIARTDSVTTSGKTMLVVVPAVIVFFVSACVYEELPRYYMGFFDGLGLLNVRQLGKLSLLVALFFLFDRYFNHKNRFLSYFADVSFGLFFIHGFFLVLYSRMRYFYIPPNPVVNFILEFVVAMGCSLIVVYGFRKILKKQSRYVIGC